uniref:Putative ovule protein n=1 Tax=Solanum chacoense TaxID=4108 RepID=A0A0V0H0D4_SOLCH
MMFFYKLKRYTLIILRNLYLYEFLSVWNIRSCRVLTNDPFTFLKVFWIILFKYYRGHPLFYSHYRLQE